MKVVQPIRDKAVLLEFLEYLKEKSYRNYLMAMVGLNTGFRIEDILKLQVKDVNGDYIQIVENKKKKNNKMLINPDLKRAIKVYIEDMKDDDFLFTSRKGYNTAIRRESAYAILKDAANYLGLDEIGTHTLRKTFGYMLYQKTKDINLVMNLLNHKSESYTLRYIGYSQDQKDKVIKNFSVF